MNQAVKRMFALSLALILALTGADFGQTTRALAAFALPQALERIEDEAFMNDAMITGLVELPDDVTFVGKSAFEQSGVYALLFPQSVTHIGADALAGTNANYAIVQNAAAHRYGHDHER